MDEEDGLLIREYPESAPWYKRILPHRFRTSPFWIGPGFLLSVLLGLSLLIVIIVLSALLADAGGDSITTLPTAECRTSFTPLSDEFLARLHQETRLKVIEELFSDFENATANGLIYLVGGSIDNRYDTDVELPFRQESNFLYITGVTDIPDCSVIIDLRSRTTVLFVPQRGITYALWNGIAPTLAQIKQKYGVDSVYYNTEVASVVTNMTKDVLNKTDFVVYTLPGVSFPVKNFTTDSGELQVALRNARAVKTEAEIEVMRVAIAVSSDAHDYVMRLVAPDLYEYSIASSFLSYSYACSLQFQAYSPIVGAGYHSAILHYVANTDLLSWKQGNSNGHDNFLLIDAGAEYHGYGADITRTYPISGRFNSYQKNIYNAVLDVQSAVIAQMKPGVRWADIQVTTRLTCCKALLANNLIVPTFNCTTNGLTSRVVGVFLPHGVGHHLGLDVHDSWVTPTVLAKGMIVTVEPGIYFNEVIIDNALQDNTLAPSLVQSEIQKYLDMAFGGVRIEDDVLITDDGVEILSTSPRTIPELEKVVAKRD